MQNEFIIPNEFEVKISLPTAVCVKKYRFNDETTKVSNKKTITIKNVRTVALCFLGVENNLWLYQVLCLKNELDPKHCKYPTIIEKQAGVFDEIEIAVNQNGTIIKVLNRKQLQDKWKIAKEELLEKHEGGNLLNFLKDTDELVANEQSILQFVTSKDRYGLYFNSCWGVHDIRKPRFEALTINIEKRIQYDFHTLHLQVPYSNDSTLLLNSVTEQKKQKSEFKYKNNQLAEAFLTIEAPNTTSKYSVICLK